MLHFYYNTVFFGYQGFQEATSKPELNNQTRTNQKIQDSEDKKRARNLD